MSKASNDLGTPKERMDGLKALEATYVKLKNVLGQDIEVLKTIKDMKQAKSLVASSGFDH